MDRNEQHAWVVIKRLLSAIAVMHIPINLYSRFNTVRLLQFNCTYNCDSLQVVLFFGVHCGDGHVTKDAIAHAFVGLSMMTRWTYECVGISDLL
jgi:hypothetical protein